VTLFLGAINWANARCEEEKLTATPENLRKILTNVYPLIRFPTISTPELSTKVIPTGVLKEKDMIGLLTYTSLKGKSSEGKLDTETRFSVVPRTHITASTTWYVAPDFEDFKTPGNPSWKIPTAGSGLITFSATASGSDVIVGLFPTPTLSPALNKNNFLDIVFGGWGNSQHAIRLGKQGAMLGQSKGQLVAPTGLGQYWVRVNGAEGSLRIGFGDPSTSPVLTWVATSDVHRTLLQQVQYFGISGWDKAVTYQNLKFTALS